MGDTPLLERVKALAPLVEASADEMERRAALTDEVAAAIRESGALHLMVPASMGGDELGIVDDIEVFEELARQDGSVGWSTMAASVSTTFAAIFTSDDVAEGVFGTDREAVGVRSIWGTHHCWNASRPSPRSWRRRPTRWSTGRRSPTRSPRRSVSRGRCT